MASIRAYGDGKLFIDFRYGGERCREYTLLEDTPANRKRLAKILQTIEKEIEAGTFRYRAYFPQSKLAERFDPLPTAASAPVGIMPVAPAVTPMAQTPLFSAFVETWFADMSVGWRHTYQETVRQILDSRLIPEFGAMAVGSIRREHILSFRSTLAKVPGRKGETLSPRRINAIVLVLRQVLNEAADRFDFTTPTLRIKPLKVKKTDIKPFTLDEVRMILDRVRPDFRNYYAVRFFTGMRTGEVDGLKWKYVDFERRLILVRESFTWGEQDYTKTDDSQRDVQMSGPVFEAFCSQFESTGNISEYVFCTHQGNPLDVNNVTKRVWYPLLRHLDLEARTPYQTRHTAATLWLASGENPQWIARQLGHSSTEMLFKVYARFVPNLTRQDGSAFERLLLLGGTPQAARPVATEPVGRRAANEDRAGRPPVSFHDVPAASKSTAINVAKESRND
jgi:integrase